MNQQTWGGIANNWCGGCIRLLVSVTMVTVTSDMLRDGCIQRVVCSLYWFGNIEYLCFVTITRLFSEGSIIESGSVAVHSPDWCNSLFSPVSPSECFNLNIAVILYFSITSVSSHDIKDFRCTEELPSNIWWLCSSDWVPSNVTCYNVQQFLSSTKLSTLDTCKVKWDLIRYFTHYTQLMVHNPSRRQLMYSGCIYLEYTSVIVSKVYHSLPQSF